MFSGISYLDLEWNPVCSSVAKRPESRKKPLVCVCVFFLFRGRIYSGVDFDFDTEFAFDFALGLVLV